MLHHFVLSEFLYLVILIHVYVSSSIVIYLFGPPKLFSLRDTPQCYSTYAVLCFLGPRFLQEVKYAKIIAQIFFAEM